MNYYVLLHIYYVIITSLLRHYYVIIKSLLQKGNHVIMIALLLFCKQHASIIKLLLQIIKPLLHRPLLLPIITHFSPPNLQMLDELWIFRVGPATLGTDWQWNPKPKNLPPRCRHAHSFESFLGILLLDPAFFSTTSLNRTPPWTHHE